MTLKINEVVVAEITTNHGMTVEEALYSIGYDVNSAEDCERAYDEEFPAAYMDDFGNYHIDTDIIEMVY